jgi:hypothetical protein
MILNVTNSVEAFLNTNVVQPYNAAIVGTNYDSPVSIMLSHPDDATVIAAVPTIVMELPNQYQNAVSTGAGDREVWSYFELYHIVYPGLQKQASTATNNESVGVPSIASAQILLSLFTQISTALTIPIYDYSTNPATQVEVAYITTARILPLRGKVPDMLAFDKHRFDFILNIRVPTLALNG